MSEQWSQSESDTPVLEPDAAGRIDANGTDPDSAVATDESADEAIAAGDESTNEAASEVIGAATDTEATDIEVIDDAVAAEATADDATAGDTGTDGLTASQAGIADVPATDTPSATDDLAASTADSGADEGSAFLVELARAMQTTAGLERVRTSEDTERRRQAHIDAVRAMESAQADSIRELAGEDLKTIEAWAETETKRIQLERERRAAGLNRELETSLSEHHAKIDREVEAVEAAIAGYQSEVVAFFESLEHETDPVAIARHAARRPVFPALDTSSDVAGPPPDAAQSGLVGVMASSPEEKPAEEWAAPSAPSETTPVTVPEATAEPTPGPAEPVEPEPVSAGIGAAKGEGGSILQSVPVHRPMSWLRRDSNGSDRSDNDD